MGLDTLLRKLEGRASVTPATAGVTANESAVSSPALHCTAVSAVTGPNGDMSGAEETVPMSDVAWLLPLSVYEDDEMAGDAEADGGRFADLTGRASDDSAVMRRLRGEPLEPEGPTSGWAFDDRRTCRQCLNLTVCGGCLAAQRGELNALSTYEPIQDLPQRCEGYLPDEDDWDSRPGWLRWPGLVSTEKLRQKQRAVGRAVPVAEAADPGTAVQPDAGITCEWPREP